MSTTVLMQPLKQVALKAIDKYFHQTMRYEKAVIRDRDPEDLHQMRVGIRRLRTAMQVFSPVLQLPKTAQEKQIAAFSRTLGKLRDLDVIEATFQQDYLPKLPQTEQVVLQSVLRLLAQRRRRAFKRVKHLLHSSRYDAFKRALTEWLQEPKGTPLANQPLYEVLADLALPLCSQLWLHPGWLVGTDTNQSPPTVLPLSTQTEIEACLQGNSTLIHSLRKQVKRIRYQLRMLADFYPDPMKADLAALETIQETLGWIQDSQVLEEFLSQALPDFRDRIPTLADLLAQSRHHAWTQWQPLQEHYLNPNNRHTLRQKLLNCIPPQFNEDSPPQVEPSAPQPNPQQGHSSHSSQMLREATPAGI